MKGYLSIILSFVWTASTIILMALFSKGVFGVTPIYLPVWLFFLSFVFLVVTCIVAFKRRFPWEMLISGGGYLISLIWHARCVLEILYVS